MKLYEIKDTMKDTLDILLESDQDELDVELYKEGMELLKSELKHKSSNIIKYINNINSDVSSVKEEIERLTKIKRSKENKVKSLKGYLVETMTYLEKKKIETELGSYGLRKSSSVEVYDPSKLPESCLRKKVDISVDKKQISNLIKLGQDIEGASIIEKYSLQIR